MKTDFKEVIPGTIPTKILHQLLLGSIAPRPIAFVSTISADGIPNLAPFSFFNVFSANPPTVIFSPARRVRDNTTKDTLSNVLQVPQAVINVVPFSLVDQCNLASAEYLPETNEFEKAGLTPLASDLVRPFRIAESPVQMEAEVNEIKPLASSAGAGILVICTIVKMHILESILNENGLIDPQKIDLSARMSENFWNRASGKGVFTIERPLAVPAVGIDNLPEGIKNSAYLTGSTLARLANVEALPDAETISNFMLAEGKAVLMQCPDKQSLAAVASQWVEEGKRDNALLLLLGSEK